MRSLTLLLARPAAALALAALAAAGIPPGYYGPVDTTNAATLRTTLHEVIDDHVRFPYTASSTDTWDILEIAQQNPSNGSQIIDVYRNRTFTKQGGGNSFYNREHTWPKSYGFPDDGATNYPYTDCFQLWLCDDGYNTARSNKPFRICSSSCLEEPTDANGGQGGGTGSYPGNSCWTSGSFTTGTWEVWGGRRGDIARAMFYMDVRYEGGTHGTTGASEPDLILTDSTSLIDSGNTGSNESVAYMGLLSVLLQWHVQDPVDDFERNRNEVVSAFQGNRNPFIDHPEWVDCLFTGSCAPVVASFCDATDGALFFCPCGNQGNADSGCEIAQGTGGVRLELIEQTTTVNGATLRGTGFPAASTPTAIAIRSAALEATPQIFGDGLRCVTTAGLVRLAASTAFSGVSTHVFGHSAMAGSGAFHYQLWFRNTPATYCTPESFNLSNGVSLAWP